MSFSLSLQCFENGTLSSFPRSVAWNIFGQYLHPSNDGLELWYNNQYDGTLLMKDEVEITGVSINRPGNHALRDLYRLACLTPSVIYWGTSYAVTNASYISGLPKYLIEAFTYEPHIVGSADEFLECLAHH
jgi:hypothetical protein